MARVQSRVPDAHLVLAGRGAPEYERHLRAEADRLGVRATFAGFVEGPAKEALLAEAAVFALPSHRENFGIAVVEAMAAAVPVVVSPGVDLSGDIAAAGGGRVAARTPEAVADALVDLLSDPTAAAEAGRCGRAYVERAFAPAVVGRQLLHLYREASGLAPG
jgi:glycosyltransferase involved in cell wall biosynthesis